MRKEIESWGVTYERYALGNELGKLAPQLKIEHVAELPAHGVKAMPSVYSIGFGLAGAKVTLINGLDTYRSCWERLGLRDRVDFQSVDSITSTGLPAESFDLVWNFAYLPIAPDSRGLLEEMKRLSRRYVAIFSVNYANLGFHWHRALHLLTKLPWTHGDVRLNKQSYVAAFMRRHGLRISKKGYVDCPVWPDSLGFRDMRLHKQNITFDNVHWKSPYIDYLESGRFPLWIKLVYAWERIPNLPFLKTLYAHINYVVGKKTS